MTRCIIIIAQVKPKSYTLIDFLALMSLICLNQLPLDGAFCLVIHLLISFIEKRSLLLVLLTEFIHDVNCNDNNQDHSITRMMRIMLETD